MEFYILNNQEKYRYEEFNEKYGNIFQSLKWIESNGLTDYEIVVGIEKEQIVISGLFLICNDREFLEYSLYFPRGPVFKEYNELIVHDFMQYIEKYAISRGVKYIRFEPFIECGECIEYENLLKKSGYDCSIYSNFWDYTWEIDIKNFDEKIYLQSLKPKTRYNINYAIRKGVRITIDNSSDSRKKFYELLKVTATRDKFNIKKYELYDNLFYNFGENVNLFWTYKDNILLSAGILIIYGKNAYYMYGASDDYNRNLQSTFLLQYEMIKFSAYKNCHKYNLGGVGYRTKNGDFFSEGLLNFKRKLGGRERKNIYSYVKNVRSV